MSHERSGKMICRCCGENIRTYLLCDHCGKPTKQIIEMNAYREVAIQMDNDSTHSTNMCKDCANTLNLSQCDEIHQLDLVHSGTTTGILVNRKAVSFTILQANW